MTKRSQLFRQVLDTHRLYRLLAGKSCPSFSSHRHFIIANHVVFRNYLHIKRATGAQTYGKRYRHIYIYIYIYIYIRGAHAAQLCCLISHSAIIELYIVVTFNISTTHSNKCNKILEGVTNSCQLEIRQQSVSEQYNSYKWSYRSLISHTKRSKFS